MIGLLNDLQDLPHKVTDPDFMQKIEEEQTGGGKV
jgi:hypothetical protein